MTHNVHERQHIANMSSNTSANGAGHSGHVVDDRKTDKVPVEADQLFYNDHKKEGQVGKREDPGDKMEKVDLPPLICSCRGVLAVISCLGFVVAYTLTVSMSVALVCMLNHTALAQDADSAGSAENETSRGNMSDVDGAVEPVSRCDYRDIDSSNTEEDGPFVWSKSVQSLVLGSYFWGYTLICFPGGILAGKFGGKRVLGYCLGMCAVCTLLYPVTAFVDYRLLLVVRFLAGMGQGVAWPAMIAVWAYWAPPSERSFLVGFTFAGAQLGNVVTFPVAGLLCKYGFSGGWPSIFYILGGFGILWFILWMLLVSDTPQSHPRISRAEKLYIQSSLEGAIGKTVAKKLDVPWRRLLTSGPVWATVLAHFCANWLTYTFLTSMPTYMKEVLHFNIKANGFLSAVPYVGMWIFIIISGLAADALVKHQLLNITHVRKLFNSLGLLVPALLVIALGFLDCSQASLAVVLVTVAIAFTGCPYSAGYCVNPADLAPKYSSLIFGISTTIATTPGFFAPAVVGLLTPSQSQEEWQHVFYIAAAVSIVGFFIYLILGSGELQPWAKERAEIPDDSEKNIEVDRLVKDNELSPRGVAA